MKIPSIFFIVRISLLTSIVFVVTKSNTVSTNGKFNNGKYMQAHVLKKLNNYGPKMCMQACSRFSGCKGINFDQTLFQCELLWVVTGDKLVDKPGFRYASISKWTIENDLCWPNPCRLLHECVVTYNNLHICIKAKTESFPQDCGSVPIGYPSGIYRIYLDSYQQEISVYCDMVTSGGGWTVFQRRVDGTVNFYRYWADYKVGFGPLEHEHWLGNENIHRITSQGNYTLRVNLEDYSENVRYAEYAQFTIGNETSQYILLLGDFTGDAGDSLTSHSGIGFTTRDVDNDKKHYNCASDEEKGGWWYTACAKANLNGLYYRNDGYYSGNFWVDFKSYNPLKKSTMMMRRSLPSHG